MPYKSDAQRKFFHTDTARKEGITSEMTHEFDEASKGKKLPEYKAEGGEMDELLDGVGQELMDSVHSRNHGKMVDALRALIAHIDMEDQKQDEESIE
jgi:hypothetical protein